MFRLLRRIRPRGPQLRAAPEVNTADFFDRQGPHMFRAPFHQPFESIKNADHVTAAENTADRDRADDAVDAGCRPATDEHAHSRSQRTRHNNSQTNYWHCSRAKAASMPWRLENQLPPHVTKFRLVFGIEFFPLNRLDAYGGHFIFRALGAFIRAGREQLIHGRGGKMKTGE